MVVILVDRSEAPEVEIEERVKWAFAVLEDMGLPMDEWPKETTMDNLRWIRRLVIKFDVDIVDDVQGCLQIYLKDRLMAQWTKPWYVLRVNPKERNVIKKYYLEMHLNYEVFYPQQQE